MSSETLKLLTTQEAAKIVRLSSRTLDAHRWRGTGPKFVRAGRRALYREADLLAWLEACQERWQERAEAAIGVVR